MIPNRTRPAIGRREGRVAVSARFLDYMLIEVGRAPNHQEPNRQVNCQQQEDFHRVLSQTVFLGSREFTHTSMRPTRKQATLAAGPRRITREILRNLPELPGQKVRFTDLFERLRHRICRP
jgi:hypothetical protein